MTTNMLDKVTTAAKKVVKVIKNEVNSGMCHPEYPGEKPDRERIHLSIVHNLGFFESATGCNISSILKNKEQKELFDHLVYTRLSKDSVLKKMRAL